MNSIPTIQREGDVAVGRNVAAGGDANIQGNARVGHNLRVEGWLDAPNIKGPLKGLYGTAEELREAYPEPRAGWYALVGTTLPADVYAVRGGKWTATGEKGGTFALYPDRLEKDVSELRAESARRIEGASWTAQDTYGTVNLERADGTVMRVAIPGMTEGKAGLFTPNRHSSILMAIDSALQSLRIEQLDSFCRIWVTDRDGSDHNVAQILGMDGEKAGLYTPARHRLLLSLIENAASGGVSRGSQSFTFTGADTYGTVTITREDGTTASVAIPGMDGEKAGLFTPNRLNAINASMTKSVTDALLGVEYEASDTYGTLWLTLPSGSRKGIGIPGMTEGKAGLFTPNRLASILSAITSAVNPVEARLASIEKLIQSDSDGAIDKFNEIVAFLAGIKDTETLDGLLGDITSLISAKADRAETQQAISGIKAAADNMSEHIDESDREHAKDREELWEALTQTENILTETDNSLSRRLDAAEADISNNYRKAQEDTAALRIATGIWPFDAIAANELDPAWLSLDDGCIAYISEAGAFRQKGLRLTSALADYNRTGDDGIILARQDRLFRLGNRLYSFDGSGLVNGAESETITEEQIRALIDGAGNDNDNQ